MSSKSKKTKRKASQETNENLNSIAEANFTDNQTKGKINQHGRQYTVSMAVSGSVIDNAQSLELATTLAGQIARAAAIFLVDEIIVFDDDSIARPTRWKQENAQETGGIFLARILQYLDTPQYLRKQLIPMNPYLRFSGLLPPLDAPRHPRATEWTTYREGCVLDNNEQKTNSKDVCLVNVGLTEPVLVTPNIEPNTRVTVCMGKKKNLKSGSVFNAVSPDEPREKEGLYWGYSVRLATGLSQIFSDCPFQEGYDYTIGTSERGEAITSADLKLPKFRHLLVVFGGPSGLEESTEIDDKIQNKDTPTLFNRYLNTCPLQGSRTIRTEEAILISLSFLQEPIWRTQGVDPFGSFQD